MNALYLQYVREQLMVATADLSGETKGQLLAWLENAQFDTKNYPRKKQRIWDEETESWITLNISIHTGEIPITPHFSLEVVHGHRPLATMHIQFISEDMSTPCISVHTDTSLLWTQTVMRKPRLKILHLTT